jgi:hypothetical protein
MGEWRVGHNLDSDHPPQNHGGLGQYIQEAGFDVLNLGIPAGSNLLAAKRVQTWLERNPSQHIDKIIMFQTEWDRDHKRIIAEDFSNLHDINSLLQRWVSCYYYMLSDTATMARCEVVLVGGIADTLWLDDFSKCYTGVSIGCQSMTNLVTVGNDRVDKPVLSWYSKYSVPLIEQIKSRLPEHRLPELLDMIDLGFERENWIFQHPDMFWPDGIHPNRQAHKILYDFLVSKGHLKSA